MNIFGGRLLEERKRLGLNQAQFAALGGVQPRAQVYYEKDERRPDANYLMAIAAAGADVCYIITGERSSKSTVEGLSGEEMALVAQFRMATQAGKKAMLTMACVVEKQDITEDPSRDQLGGGMAQKAS